MKILIKKRREDGSEASVLLHAYVAGGQTRNRAEEAELLFLMESKANYDCTIRVHITAGIAERRE